MIEVAVDNSVVSHYIAPTLSVPQLVADTIAFDEMISLAREGVIKLGGPWSTLLIENTMKSGESRHRARELKEIIKSWPVHDPDPKMTNQLVRCLHEIMQDKDGVDSKQAVIVGKLTQARHFVTLDYRFHRQYNQRVDDIKSQCDFDLLVMTPTEFMEKYKEGNL